MCNFYDFQRCEFGIGVVFCGHFLLFKKFREEFFPLLKKNLRHWFWRIFLARKPRNFQNEKGKGAFRMICLFYILGLFTFLYIQKHVLKKKDGYSSLFHVERMVYGERLNLVHFLSVYYCVSSNNPIGFFGKL